MSNHEKSGGTNARKVFSAIGRFIATCFMVGVITGCIVACVLTVYIFNMIGADNTVDLDQLELGYTSTMYYYDEESDSYEELHKLYISDNNRIWVDSSEIPDYVKQAVIAIEDKRFETHQGVDWRRTFGAFINQFIPGASTGGGSTIDQQLIKNVTGDDDIRIDRKVREIFRALELEKHYSKEQILEAYLNVVPFGAGTNGIETAALTYFGKSASELTLAEAASIVGITNAPTYYNPFLNPENNKERQEHILSLMLEQGRITKEEYDQAIAEELNFKREEHQQNQTESVMSYYEDHVINTVIADLQEEYGWTETRAEDELYRGGYKIYTCVDLEMQNYLENFYANLDNFPQIWNAEYPQSCATIIDPNGKLLAVVGGIGEKTASRTLNRATMSTRQPGSSIKPIGAYAMAFEYNRINWSTIVEDSPITINDGGSTRQWPSNYYNSYYGNMTVATAIQRSTNTIPVKLVQMLTPRVVFDFMHDRLNMYNLQDDDDVALAPLALGALTTGVTPLEMAGAYQIFNNGGSFTTPYCYTHVEDADGRVILKADTSERFVISEETSVIINRLLQSVTTSSIGTGTAAKLNSGMPTAGKTGTSEYDINQWFIGMTPYYICQVWMGYDEEYAINESGVSVPNTINYYSPSNLGYPPPKLWKSIMTPLHEGLDIINFPESENVVSKEYCSETGLLATESCPTTATGWYNKTMLPSTCSTHSSSTSSGKDKDEDDTENDSSHHSDDDNDTSDSHGIQSFIDSLLGNDEE